MEKKKKKKSSEIHTYTQDFSPDRQKTLSIQSILNPHLV